MVSVTASISDELKSKIQRFPWVNWSEVAREEFAKDEISERYMKTGKITDEDWEFCQEIGWHPVDELPLKEEYIKELEQARKEPSIKLKSIREIFE
ncbi:MAG: hypothetical protein ABIB71_03950 [Candidatus Woesearchaeota archaeon]